MTFQIRWLNALLKFKELNFESPYTCENFVEYIIKADNIKDDSMVESRSYLYRPNFKKYIKSKKLAIQ
jgi:hypothetical protein